MPLGLGRGQLQRWNSLVVGSDVDHADPLAQLAQILDRVAMHRDVDVLAVLEGFRLYPATPDNGRLNERSAAARRRK